jgi:CheY-like chemotaxis protein
VALEQAFGDEPPPDKRSLVLPDPPVSGGLARKRLQIVIIEDNRDYADSLQAFCELHGHKVTVAYTGNEGLDAVLRRVPDVVICDLGLPAVNGFEVAKTLRQNPHTANICLIAVTGYGSDQDRRDAAECGFNAHLVKPVGPMEILKLIDPESGSLAS